MCGRVAVLVSLLLGALSSFAQCDWTPRESAGFRTTALDVSVDGAYLWLATGYGVQLLDSGGTRILDSVALPGSTRVVRSAGGGLAYAGSGSRIYVLRRDGNSITVLRFVDAGGSVNDLLTAGSYLFVATSTGIAHFEAFQPAELTRTTAILPTSSANVTSLAATQTQLIAADGDASVELFSISIPSVPQHTGELSSVVRATAVHIAPDNSLLVSDAFGQNTDVFIGATAVARLAVGASAFAAGQNGTHFVAGPDRTLRAVDFRSTTGVKEVFEHQLAPTGGTDNVIHAIARSNERLYVAAGDIGLVLFDVSSLTPPFGIASYKTSPTTTTVVAGDRAWFGDRSGTVSEQRIVTSGLALTQQRTWAGGAAVHDVEGTLLLSSSDRTATLWSLTPQTPAAASTSTFRSPVRAAAIRGEKVVALLEDGSAWIGGETPQQIALPNTVQLARAGNAFLFVETRNEGKTVLHYFPSGDFTAEPRRFTLDGVAIGGIALDGTRAAVFTFAGANIVDVTSGAVRVVESSNRTIPRQLAFAGDDLLVLDGRTLYVYDDARTLVREQLLPATGVMVDAQGGIAVMATSEGMLVMSYLAQQPTRATPFTSTFYTKLAASTDRIYLSAPGVIDVFTMAGDTPRYLTGVRAPGNIDFAASEEALFSLSSSGAVTSYSRQGAPLRQITINEGPDQQPLAIDVVGGAVWVSVSKGCTTGGCQQKTLVLDPQSLAITATMNGGVKDVVAAGTRAYALFDFPAEIRVLNISSPLQPSPIVTAAAPATATAISARPGRVYVVGDKLYEYAETTLLLTMTYLTTVTPDKAQQIRVAGNCLIVTARSANPEQYNALTMAPVSTFDVPAPVRSIIAQPGRLLILTTHSLEVWASGQPARQKRRAVR